MIYRDYEDGNWQVRNDKYQSGLFDYSLWNNERAHEEFREFSLMMTTKKELWQDWSHQ